MTQLPAEPPTPRSGRQYVLRDGPYEAVVASVGASLRSFTVDGRALVVPFDADEVRPAYRGATLAPWPNRVVDGRYRFDGVAYELALTEPKRRHALHGLVAWQDFTQPNAQLSPAETSTTASVTLATTIEPQLGYPWRIALETTYALASDGLTQTVRATNQSSDRAPFGTGPHPYLVAGDGRVDDWMLELPASDVLLVTSDRLVPTEVRSVAAEPERFDFRTPRVIDGTEIDHAYTNLDHDTDRVATVRVTDAAGRGVAMTFGQDCPWVQIHTADLPDPKLPGHRAGLAVEPMTCAPDAFNSGRGLVVLAPGESTTASWRIHAVA